MSTWSEDITDTLTRVVKQRDKLFDALGTDGGSRCPPVLEEAFSLLVKQLEGIIYTAPFRKGDRVQINITPVIDDKNSPGWRGFKHFLVTGAKGTVVYVRFGSKGYEVFVEFDDESWIGEHGVKNLIAPEKRSQFRFLSDELKLEKAP